MPTDLFWQIVQAPSGMTLESANANTFDAKGYHNRATLNWTPSARDLAHSEIVVRVQDSRGGVATKRFQLPVMAADGDGDSQRWQIGRNGQHHADGRAQARG